MNKKISLILSLILLVMWLGGCSGISKAEKKEMVEAATIAGEKYIKQYYNSEFILKDEQFLDPAINSTIYLHGYIKGHEDEPISVAYDYSKKEVRTVIGPDWFIDSRNP
ncbi:hypothetical protein [Paenibacillus glacialis]|uniref:DUF1433 domain-containing protein n=1 Tax=Paenibacillus glacialis TaxID=494026 RepID=A0A168KNX3_9BACL|nr:hypothetical protein [Paenibacillus glacialis]OAB42277.1 hypothetical protein PGLA_13315 [Paenibacillus glacialis]